MDFVYVPVKGESLAEKTLASVVMTTYNQEELAVFALKSLLKQDYDNLEIIVCDDSSTDDTYENLVQCGKEYELSGGKHTLVLHKNEKNLGIAENYEQGFRMAHGEILVTQGGDDISYSHRGSSIVKAWEENGMGCAVIFHGLRAIHMDGTPGGYEWWDLTLRNPIGAAMAYTKEIVTEYLPISTPLTFEDNVFGRRAYLLGKQLQVKEVLVDYRVGSGMTSTGDTRTKRVKICRSMIASTKQNIIDLEYVQGKASSAKCQEIKEMILEISDTYGTEMQLFTSASILTRMKAFLHYLTVKNKTYPTNLKGLIIYYLPIVFPAIGKLYACKKNKLSRKFFFYYA